MKKILNIVFTTILCGILLWILISFIEVNTHNLKYEEVQYSDWNFFELVVESNR